MMDRMDDPLILIDFDDVEAGLLLRRILHEPKLRGGGDAPLLCTGDELPRLGKGRAFPALDLHEHDMLPRLRDQVDLPEAAGIVHAHDAVALFSQIFRRGALAEAACQLSRIHQCIFFKNEGRWSSQGPYSRSAA